MGLGRGSGYGCTEFSPQCDICAALESLQWPGVSIVRFFTAWNIE